MHVKVQASFELSITDLFIPPVADVEEAPIVEEPFIIGGDENPIIDVEEIPIVVDVTPVVVDVTPVVVDVTPVVEETPVVDEKTPDVEVSPVVEETPVIEETPDVVEKTPVVVDVKTPDVEETPIVVETPVVEVSPDVEETPMEKGVGYAVILADFGAWKVNVIKEIRAVTGLSLFDAKNLVERAPTLVTSGVSKEEAMKIRDVLTNAGATVEIKI